MPEAGTNLASSNSLSVTDTFDDGSIGNFTQKSGTVAVQNSSLVATSTARLVLPGRKYSDSTILFTISHLPDSGSGWAGVTIRANSENDGYTVSGPQSTIYVRQVDSSGSVRVYLRNFDSVTGTSTVTAVGPLLTTVNAHTGFSLKVTAIGQDLTVIADKEPALNYSGLPQAPINGGYISLQTVIPKNKQGFIKYDNVMVRNNSDIPDISIDANGTIWLSLMTNDLFKPFLSNTFLFNYGNNSMNFNVFSSMISSMPKSAILVDGIGNCYVILGLVNVAPLSGTLMSLSYKGQTDVVTAQ